MSLPEDGKLAYRHHGGTAGDLLAAVIGAIGDGSWRRLKACPDCHWVFTTTPVMAASGDA